MAAAYYFIDYTNGNDARTGLRIPAGDITSVVYNTIDSVPDDTNFIDAALTGADDYITGSFVYNVTKGQGRLITDFDAGSDRATVGVAMAPIWEAGDEYYILDSWKTITQFNSTTVRTAGDIAYLRANMTHTQGAADVTNDEAGTLTAYISMIGCNATQLIDPWHDASDTRPVIDFAGGAYQYLPIRAYWAYRNLKFTNSTDANAIVFGYSSSNYNIFTNCVFNNDDGDKSCVYWANCSVEFNSCAFEGAANSGVTPSCSIYNGGTAVFNDCTFNATTTTYYGLSVTWTAGAVLNNCSFGNTNTYAGYDISCGMSRIYLRNCKLYSANKVNAGLSSFVFSDDDAQVSGAQKAWMRSGTSEKETGVIRPNGSLSTVKMSPGSSCSTVEPLTVGGTYPLQDFKVWCKARPTTITLYILSLGVWGGAYPTNTELYVQASYYNAASPTATRSTVNSTAVLSDTTTWVPFTVSVTPAQDGFVYITVLLTKYVASCGCYVDPKPIVS